MPSRVGCALERRTLCKQFDELVGVFIGFTAAHRLRANVRIWVLRLLLVLYKAGASSCERGPPGSVETLAYGSEPSRLPIK